MDQIQEEIVVTENSAPANADCMRDFQLLELALRGGGVGDVQF